MKGTILSTEKCGKYVSSWFSYSIYTINRNGGEARKNESELYQDTWSCVSSQERHKTHSVLFTGSGKFLISTPCISGTTQWIFIKFTCFMLYIYMTLHIKFERNWVSDEQDIHFQKLPNFLHIFLLLLLRTAFEEFLNHIKITFP